MFLKHTVLRLHVYARKQVDSLYFVPDLTNMQLLRLARFRHDSLFLNNYVLLLFKQLVEKLMFVCKIISSRKLK